MTDRPGATPPFPGFPGFPPAEMVDRMWDMMRLTPFGTSFPGGQPGAAQGLGPSLSMMSDMMAPLTNVEELDKRITDMRAVEQWLKLNLNMLQSAIQALEVQRATLATLRAFGASFAQSSGGAGASPSPWSSSASASPFAKKDPEPAASASASASSESSASGKAAESSEGAEGGAQPGQAFDTSGWWNLLQSQFNQLAQFAMTQPGAQGAAGEAPSSSATKPAAAKRPAAKRAASSKPSGGAKESSEPRTTRGAKKAPPQPE
jgi:hypothetical protein